jgi:hypothetical protein
VIAIGKSPLCFARPLGEATHVINDDWKAFLNIGGAAIPRNRPFLALDGYFRAAAPLIAQRDGTRPFAALAIAS